MKRFFGKGKQWIAGLLCICLLAGAIPIAANSATNTEAPVGCEHHIVHDAACGYA